MGACESRRWRVRLAVRGYSVRSSAGQVPNSPTSPRLSLVFDLNLCFCPHPTVQRHLKVGTEISRVDGEWMRRSDNAGLRSMLVASIHGGNRMCLTNPATDPSVSDYLTRGRPPAVPGTDFEVCEKVSDAYVRSNPCGVNRGPHPKGDAYVLVQNLHIRCSYSWISPHPVCIIEAPRHKATPVVLVAQARVPSDCWTRG